MQRRIIFFLTMLLCQGAFLEAGKKRKLDETEETSVATASAAEGLKQPDQKKRRVDKGKKPVQQATARVDSDKEGSFSSSASETEEEKRERLLKKVTRFAKPTNDIAFKQLMRGEPGEPQEHAVSFLKAMTGLDIKKIQTMPEALPQLGERLLVSGEQRYQSFMDFACRNEKNELLIVEVQVRREDFFDSRALCYAAGTFASQLKKYDKWSDLKNVVVLQILGHKTKKPFPDDAFEVRYEMRADLENFDVIDPGISMIQIELPRVKLPLLPANTNPLKKAWLTFFKTAHKQQEVPQDVPDVIKTAYERLETMHGDCTHCVNTKL